MTWFCDPEVLVARGAALRSRPTPATCPGTSRFSWDPKQHEKDRRQQERERREPAARCRRARSGEGRCRIRHAKPGRLGRVEAPTAGPAGCSTKSLIALRRPIPGTGLTRSAESRNVADRAAQRFFLQDLIDRTSLPVHVEGAGACAVLLQERLRVARACAASPSGYPSHAPKTASSPAPAIVARSRRCASSGASTLVISDSCARNRRRRRDPSLRRTPPAARSAVVAACRTG